MRAPEEELTRPGGIRKDTCKDGPLKLKQQRWLTYISASYLSAFKVDNFFQTIVGVKPKEKMKDYFGNPQTMHS